MCRKEIIKDAPPDKQCGQAAKAGANKSRMETALSHLGKAGVSSSVLSESDISRYPYLVPRLRKKPLGLSPSWTVSAVSFFVDYCQVEDMTFSYYFSVFFF